jgi:hypothetical protein
VQLAWARRRLERDSLQVLEWGRRRLEQPVVAMAVWQGAGYCTDGGSARHGSRAPDVTSKYNA